MGQAQSGQGGFPGQPDQGEKKEQVGTDMTLRETQKHWLGAAGPCWSVISNWTIARSAELPAY